MITFNHICEDIPYVIFKENYEKSLNADQKNIEALCISSYSNKSKEVNSRYVNLKFIDDKEFIFFSNYRSPKSKEFESHPQITALIYWNSINVQIRMKAFIKKSSKEFNNSYFINRDKNKNALAISSDQSTPIESYNDVRKKYLNSLGNDNLKECPDYWGGYSFAPYYFEFWEGNTSRINKRNVYEIKDNSWTHKILQP